MAAAATQCPAELLSGRGAVGAVGLLKDLTSRWVRGSQELRELGVAEGSVTVGVNSADDGQKLTLGGIVTTASEERAEVQGADATVVVLIDRSVRGIGREVVAALEVTLEDVKSALEADFLLENVKESLLNVKGQAVVAANVPRRAVEGDVAQQVVFAGQKELEEPKERVNN